MSSIHGDKKLQQLFLERFYFPRRKMQRRVVDEAIACGELKPDTDPELLIDALYGPCYFRWLRGHAPVDKTFAEALVHKVLEAFTPN
jgi:hypothetical protein